MGNTNNNEIQKELGNIKPNINHCIELIDNIHNAKEKGENFNLLIEKADIPTLVNEVYKKYNGKYDKIVELIENSKLNSITTKNVKVIGMYYPRLTNGGIERVMEHLTKLYISMGYKVVLITDTPSKQDYIKIPKNAIRYDIKKGNSYKDRAEQIQKVVKGEKVDAVIYHSWCSNLMAIDMMLYKALDVPFIIHTHGIFSFSLMNHNPYFGYMPQVYSVADSVITLDEVDADYWKNFNSKVFTVFNPTTIDIKSSKLSKLENNTILWVARISPEKKPEEALFVLSEVCKEIENVKLKMLGQPNTDKNLEQLQILAKKLGVEKNVEFCGFHEDVSNFYLESSVVLSTSSIEGFSLVFLESKTCGVPIVLYDLPYLTLCDENRGMLPVKYGDHKAAAREIIDLFLDREKLKNAGLEGRKHALELADYKYEENWNNIFNNLSNVRGNVNLSKSQIQMWKTFMHDYSFKDIDKQNSEKYNNIQKIKPKEEIKVIDKSKFENEFHIVFISEEKNIKSLAVALTSLFENKDTSKYNIYILHKDKYSSENIDLITNLGNKYNCIIEFKNLEKSYKLNPKDITKTISKTLGIEKCIYLSFDVVVQKDLIELYNTDLENCSIGAVKEGNNFNSSVLLIDNKINNDDIKSIELKYNLNAEYFGSEPSFNFNKQVKLKPELIKEFSKKELKSALRDNVIFSYQNGVNPLTDSECSLSYEWFRYFRLSPLNKIERKVCKNPKVSVIVPVFNVDKYIRESLDSIINQTLEDIEIICVDDGSTDDSLVILKEYAEFDKRITILEQENQGAGSARNNGLDVAKGEYLSFLDPDDLFELTLLEKTYYLSKKKNLDILVYDYMLYNQSQETFNIMQRKLPNKKEIFSHLDMKDNIFFSLDDQAWNKLFKRDFIIQNKIRFQHVFRNDDVYFTNASVGCAKRIFVIDTKFIYYRVGINNNSQSTLYKHPLCFYDAELGLRDKFKEIGIYDTIERGFLTRVINGCIINMNKNRNTPAFEVIYNHLKENLNEDFGITKHPREFYLTQLYDVFMLILNTPFEGYLAINGIKSYDKKITNNVNNQTKVSIVIPVYNAEEFLEECIGSVLSQTLKEIEIICVDDGSTDNSLEILKKFTENNGNFKVITQKNQYAGVARNNGLKVAQGEYVYFFDSDDIMYDDNVFEKMYNLAKINNLDILRGKAVTLDHKTNKIVKHDYYDLKSIPNNYFNRELYLNTQDDYKALFLAINAPWGGICKREFLIENNIEFPDTRCANDEAFYVETILKASKTMIMPIYIQKYRVNNEKSLIGMRCKHYGDVISSYKRIEKLFNNNVTKISNFVLNLYLSNLMVWLVKSENTDYFQKNLNLAKVFFDNLDYSYWGGKDNCQVYLNFYRYFEEKKEV